MPIKTKLTDLTPSRTTLKKEIQVLSHGYYTADKWPDGNVTVYPWDSYIDSAFLRKVETQNAELAIYDILPRVCTLNGMPLDDVLIGDAQTILLVARAARKACKVEVSVPLDSGKMQAFTINIPDGLERIAEKSANYVGYDNITLPVCEDVVALRPLTIGDERAVLSRADTERAQLPDRILRVLRSIVSVGDGKPDNPEELITYWKALTPQDQSYIFDQQDLLYPHLNNTVTFVDTETKKSFKYVLDLDSKFFR